MSDECMSTKLGVTGNLVSSFHLFLYIALHSKCIEHYLMALAPLLHVILWLLLLLLLLLLLISILLGHSFLLNGACLFVSESDLYSSRFAMMIFSA